MTSKSSKKTSKSAPHQPPAAALQPPSRGALLTLIALASGETALAIFQWIELVIVRRGGSSICAVNSTINCERVWNSPAALALSNLFGLPVAGMGLAWGLAAAVVCVLLFNAVRDGRPWQAQAGALWVLGGVGLASVVLFALLSLKAEGVCLLCLATYALVIAFFATVFLRVPRTGFAPEERARTLLWAVVPPFAAYVVLLVPGSMTPKAASQSVQTMAAAAQTVSTTQGGPDAQLASFIESLPTSDRQHLSDTLAQYKLSPAQPVPPARDQLGPSTAPVRVIEFTDIRCPHCRVLVEAMEQIEKLVPAGSLAVEGRHFPLDKDCNPKMQFSDGQGTRCAGAKAQICLEGRPDYWSLRKKLFENQATLTPEQVVAIASGGSLSRGALEACMASPETAQKLSADLTFAEQYHPQGTPLVIINGREAMPYPPLIYALALSQGNPDAPGFAGLPPPKVLDR